MTVSDILNDESLDKMIAHGDAFNSKTIRASSAFWQQKQKELMSMIRQLVCPTFFLTISAAETKWPELLRILKEILDDVKLPTDAVLELQWNERAELIMRDPITSARYLITSLRRYSEYFAQRFVHLVNLLIYICMLVLHRQSTALACLSS